MFAALDHLAPAPRSLRAQLNPPESRCTNLHGNARFQRKSEISLTQLNIRRLSPALPPQHGLALAIDLPAIAAVTARGHRAGAVFKFARQPADDQVDALRRLGRGGRLDLF